MWGKVLPEMARFLVHRPFGLKAPLGGLALATNVYNSVQMQLQTDGGELADFVKAHPETVRMLGLMTPGIPWDIPMNMPLFARRLQEVAQENTQLRAEGKPTKPFDAAGTVADSVLYSVMYGKNIQDLGAIAKEFVPPGGGPTFGGPEGRPTKSSGETEAAYLARVATYNAANPVNVTPPGG